VNTFESNQVSYSEKDLLTAAATVRSSSGSATFILRVSFEPSLGSDATTFTVSTSFQEFMLEGIDPPVGTRFITLSIEQAVGEAGNIIFVDKSSLIRGKEITDRSDLSGQAVVGGVAETLELDTPGGNDSGLPWANSPTNEGTVRHPGVYNFNCFASFDRKAELILEFQVDTGSGFSTTTEGRGTVNSAGTEIISVDSGSIFLEENDKIRILFTSDKTGNTVPGFETQRLTGRQVTTAYGT